MKEKKNLLEFVYESQILKGCVKSTLKNKVRFSTVEPSLSLWMVRYCLGHPAFLLGHLVTWVKRLKYLSPFLIKANSDSSVQVTIHFPLPRRFFFFRQTASSYEVLLLSFLRCLFFFLLFLWWSVVAAVNRAIVPCFLLV